MREITFQEKLLIWLLRFGGTVMCLAFLAMIMPTSWMVANHRWLGLGELPQATIVEYLTRSISALYGVHGGLLLVLSTNVRRFAPVIRYIAVMNIVLGVALLAIDIEAGMPWYWTVSEGPPVGITGVLFLVLARRLPPPVAAG